MPIADYLTPASLVRSARSAHPAFKYVIAAAGVAGMVVVLTNYGTSYATLVFGAILLFVLMVMFLVFSQATAVAKAHLALSAAVLVWAFLLLGVLTAILLFTSAFIDKPLPFRSYIIRQLESSTPVVTVEKADARPPTESAPPLSNPKSPAVPSQNLHVPQEEKTSKISPLSQDSKPQESRTATQNRQLNAPQSEKATEASQITTNSNAQESRNTPPGQNLRVPQEEKTSKISPLSQDSKRQESRTIAQSWQKNAPQSEKTTEAGQITINSKSQVSRDTPPSQNLSEPQGKKITKISPLSQDSKPQESRTTAQSSQKNAPQSEKTTEADKITTNSKSQVSSPPRSQQLSTPQSVRASVKTVASAVQGETMSSRLAAISAAQSSLPDDLSGPEIALLLADETMSSRFAILQLLTKRTKQKSLDPHNVAAILAEEDMSTRESMTAILAPLIKSPIAANLLDEILGPATDCTRARCIRHLAPIIERPIPEPEIGAILESISGSCRSQAIAFLFSERLE